MGFIEQKKSAEQKQKTFVRRLMAGAASRAQDAADQVNELELLAKKINDDLEKARWRLSVAEKSRDELQAMWKDLDE